MPGGPACSGKVMSVTGQQNGLGGNRSSRRKTTHTAVRVRRGWGVQIVTVYMNINGLLIHKKIILKIITHKKDNFEYHYNCSCRDCFNVVLCAKCKLVV